MPGNASCPIDLGEFAPSLKKKETFGLTESADEHSSQAPWKCRAGCSTLKLRKETTAPLLCMSHVGLYML